ncbi:hypothetical protein, partial [Salmonella enterica]|uniref:hypothetical protein n=1 Tax=Salmonella enterica TaxID=28901 RepID=UPI003733BB4A
PTLGAFWPQRINHFRCLPRDAFYVDSLMFTVLTALHLPGCGCQEDTPLTICIPRTTCVLLRCQTRYFIQDPGLTW